MPERTPRKLNAQALWEYALRLLSARAYAIAELRDKLLRRAENPGDVSPVLSRLKEYGYVNDERFAQSYSAARLENEGFGKQRVLHDLRKRRVARAVAEKAVDAIYAEADELQLIEKFVRRKFRNIPLEQYLAEPKHLAAAYRRLRSAGFSSGNVVRMLKRFARDPDMLDSLEPPEEGPEAG
ncbi:MAG: recombination regulator RecX [Acidobacteria bacterium]|nr:recombination regulator RecX [Acidobacteriota bacterium]